MKYCLSQHLGSVVIIYAPCRGIQHTYVVSVFFCCVIVVYSMCFYSESECACLISIHTMSSYDLKLIVVDFLSGKMKRGINWGSGFEGETNGY